MYFGFGFSKVWGLFSIMLELIKLSCDSSELFVGVGSIGIGLIAVSPVLKEALLSRNRISSGNPGYFSLTF
jgi:hypothetical protein